MIELAFSKKKVEDRKKWLTEFVPGTFIDYKGGSVSYSDFVNKELILFSNADNLRSIPSLMDGLKPGQRKIMYCCFKKNIVKEIKVGQLVGIVGQMSAYHHGEASLSATIVNLAQDFVGSNNINLLLPIGQFGTRHMAGKDSASARYIFTALNPLSRLVFHKDDDQLLKYLDDDGMVVEPEWYSPIIPMVLVNGADGIGTGWSTNVPNFHPLQLIEVLKRLLLKESSFDDMEVLHPFYRGFVGEIIPASKGQGYEIYGAFEIIDSHTLRISELPVRGKPTEAYKVFLEELMGEGGFITDICSHHTDVSVEFLLTTSCNTADKSEAEWIKVLKLKTTLAMSNMVLFDSHGQLRKYESVVDVISEFYGVRMYMYHQRKEHLIRELSSQVLKLNNKVRFIKAVVSEKFRINNRKKADILQDLKALKYDMFPKGAQISPDEHSSNDDDDAGGNDLAAGYDYLLSMKLWSLSLEMIRKLEEECKQMQTKLDELMDTTPEQLWLDDLEALRSAYEEDEVRRLDEMKNISGAASAKRKIAAKPKKNVKKPKIAKDEDECSLKAPAKKVKKEDKSGVAPKSEMKKDEFGFMAAAKKDVKSSGPFSAFTELSGQKQNMLRLSNDGKKPTRVKTQKRIIVESSSEGEMEVIESPVTKQPQRNIKDFFSIKSNKKPMDSSFDESFDEDVLDDDDDTADEEDDWE